MPEKKTINRLIAGGSLVLATGLAGLLLNSPTRVPLNNSVAVLAENPKPQAINSYVPLVPTSNLRSSENIIPVLGSVTSKKHYEGKGFHEYRDHLIHKYLSGINDHPGNSLSYLAIREEIDGEIISVQFSYNGKKYSSYMYVVSSAQDRFGKSKDKSFFDIGLKMFLDKNDEFSFAISDERTYEGFNVQSDSYHLKHLRLLQQGEICESEREEFYENEDGGLETLCIDGEADNGLYKKYIVDPDEPFLSGIYEGQKHRILQRIGDLRAQATEKQISYIEKLIRRLVEKGEINIRP